MKHELKSDGESCSCGCDAHEHCCISGCPHCDLLVNKHIRRVDDTSKNKQEP